MEKLPLNHIKVMLAERMLTINKLIAKKHGETTFKPYQSDACRTHAYQQETG